MSARTVYLDPDYRREPRTSLYCYICQRDIVPSRPYWQVAVSLDDAWSMHGVHPDDADATTAWHPVGPECARRIGLQWFRRAPGASAGRGVDSVPPRVTP